MVEGGGVEIYMGSDAVVEWEQWWSPSGISCFSSHGLCILLFMIIYKLPTSWQTPDLDPLLFFVRKARYFFNLGTIKSLLKFFKLIIFNNNFLTTMRKAQCFSPKQSWGVASTNTLPNHSFYFSFLIYLNSINVSCELLVRGLGS